MRLAPTFGLVISTLALMACGGPGGKPTKDDLARSVTDALTRKDKAAFSGLYVTVDAAISACPALSGRKDKLRERFANTLAKATSNFETCAALDWSKAKVLETKGGDLREPEKECPDLTGLRGIEILAEIDGKKVVIRLEAPVKVKSGYFLSDIFACEVQSGEEPKAEEPKAEEPRAEEPRAEAPKAEEPKAEEPKAAEAPAGEPAGGAEKPAAGGEGTGNETCDKFINAFEKCIALMPEVARGPANDSVKQMREAWASVPDKSFLTSSCQQAYDTMKTSMAQFCPGVFE